MSINAQAVELIQNTAVAASANRIHYVKGDAPHVFYLQDENGKITKQFSDPAPMAAHFKDWYSLVSMAFRSFKKGGSTSVWYSASGVVLVIDPQGRDRGTITLTFSDPFSKLHEWDKSPSSMSHAQLYQMLRTTMADALPQHPDLRGLVRKVNIQRVQQLNSEQTKTKVSVDRSLLAQAAGSDALPDVLTFTVPLFSEPIAAPIKVNVRVAFELDPESGNFKFNVLPNEIESAVGEGEDWIEQKIMKVMSQFEPAIDDATAKVKSNSPAGKVFADSCAVYRGAP